MNKLRLGFVGAGVINQRLLPHFAVADTAAVVDITGICDPIVERAQHEADQFATARAYPTLDAMLDDDRIDAVTIGSPIGLHYEHCMAALTAGKHVHVNKTMCVTTAEADALIAAAEQHSVRLVASPGEMLRPHNQQIKKMIDAGDLGTLAWAMCGAAFGNYHADEPERRGSHTGDTVDPTWYFKNPGGGPLYDLTVYSLHGLTGILGPVRRVTALSGTLLPHREVNGKPIAVEAHDNTVMLLDFGDNRFAVAYGTAAGNLRTRSDIEFDFSGRYFGTHGTITGLLLNGAPFDYPGCEIARQAPDGGVHSNFGGNEWVLPHISEPHRSLQELHVFEDIMQMVDWAREGHPSIATAEHARHVIEIIEMAYLAAETGVAQTLNTKF
ncbi:Gfo/Idh/MocA family protein [Mycolicibacterium stellerae]|uniref:Gfo/Idh/MocA family protein n=1 Tax=Mycolicibacterium stellerae TaxID=2358193 RepID=UPI000F0B0704|nr:Gfo/Idh/MocA family oxidoreductase [Mycolicibacterium stellerae]